MDKRARIIDSKLSAIRGGAARAMNGRGMVPNESDEKMRWQFHQQNPRAMSDYIRQVAAARGITEGFEVNNLAISYISEMESKFG